MIRQRIRRVASRIRRRLSRGPSAPERVVPVPLPSAPVAPSSGPVSPFAGASPAADTAPAAAAPGTIRPEEVEALFDARVRPALQADGGDIELVRIVDNDVFVRLQGACSTCPSSTITMRMGVERILAETFPQFGSLVQLHEPA